MPKYESGRPVGLGFLGGSPGGKRFRHRSSHHSGRSSPETWRMEVRLRLITRFSSRGFPS
ncbi:hypothetical protein TSMEX_009446 [Taenia solium]|eukprot:TsM_000246800 transcript=TsM_000246800 gene=TsM_000246800